MDEIKKYNFYGWETADVMPTNDKYKFVGTPRNLYDILSEIWCEYTCAPRLREKWSEDNKTAGQCSITAFLAQDIYGGKVCGIPTGSGVHCFNVVGDCVFDLTSEQFGDEAKNLVYTQDNEQSRDEHFAKEEKKKRYEYLKGKLDEIGKAKNIG